MRCNAIDVVPAVDPWQHRDAISYARVLLELVTLDRCQLRLVREVEDADLGIDIEDGRDLGVIEVEIDQQRPRFRGHHGCQPDGYRGCPIGACREETENRHPDAPPAGIPCCMSPGCIVARTIPPWSAYQTTCGRSFVGIQSSADPCPAWRTRTSCM